MYKKKKYLCLLCAGALCVSAAAVSLPQGVWASGTGYPQTAEGSENQDVSDDAPKEEVPESDDVSDTKPDAEEKPDVSETETETGTEPNPEEPSEDDPMESPDSDISSDEKETQDTAVLSAAGWNLINGVWYYLDADGAPVVGWVQDGGNWYYTDSHGAMTSGFKIVDGKRYYLNASGVLQTGWILVDGYYYFSDESGATLYGWVYTDSAWYYLSPVSGRMLSGWQHVDGRTYYLNASGVLQTGWFLIDGFYHYADENGAICSGWTEIDGIRYYLRSDGMMMSGWQIIDGKKYFLNASGITQTGWVLVNGVYYFADENGVMQTGWVLDGGKYYYLDANSAMTSGWKYVDGYWYYLNASGVMQVGWVDEGGNRYFLNASGHRQTGWITVDGVRYYMNAAGAMVRNAWVGDYYCGSDGTLATKEKMNGVSKRSSTRIVYSSKTLHIVLERHTESGSTYWTAHVQTSSPDQLRSCMSYDSYGGKRQRTSEAVPAHGGIIGINGSAFDYSSGKPSPLGMCIKDGVIYGDYMTSYTVMATTYDGLIFTPPQGLMGADLLNMGVKDTYNFGPILINGGVPQMPIEVTSYKDPRVAVGMISQNDYVLLCADGRGAGGSKGLNHTQMVNIFQSFGCTYAYNLDGGGSATLYYNGVVMNNPSDGSERPCADFLFFTP